MQQASSKGENLHCRKKEGVRMIKSFEVLQVEQFNDTHNFVDGRGSAVLLVKEVQVLWP
jgi:hypothetical protein